MRSKIIAAVAAVVGVSLITALAATAATSSRAPAPRQLSIGLSTAGVDRAGQAHGETAKGTVIAPTADGWQPFRSDCGDILPRSGPGSLPRLATEPVAAALSRVPALSELAHALQRTGLTARLNSVRALTIFAPSNAAFHAIGAGNLRELLATRPDLVRVVTFGLVPRRVPPAELVGHHVLTTVAGTKVSVVRSGHSFGVNNAAVTCSNVRTANATVYVVNRLLVPGS